MTTGDRDKTQRLIAWTLVVGMHLGLFWLLTATPGPRRTGVEPARLRLVFIAPAAAPIAEAPPVGKAALPRRLQAALVERTAPPSRREPPTLPQAAAPTTIEAPIDWQRQARDRGNAQAPSDASRFAPDPLRSRRANLPGGDRPDTFAMRRAVSPADVVGMIGGLFGAYPPPCPRVRQNIAGLLTSTSDRDRKLLQEELRQQREYCAP